MGKKPSRDSVTALPDPELTGGMTLEEALEERRSVRDYTGAPLTLAEVSQLLWAAQGVTDDDGGRTAPSAGGLYPLELYVLAGEVEDLAPGLYKYRPSEHELLEVSRRDLRKELSAAALDQEWVEEGAVVIVIAAVTKRTTGKYEQRGVRYVHMEVGHAAQNIYLQAAALDLGTVMVGAFEDRDVARVLGLPREEIPLAILPIGALE